MAQIPFNNVNYKALYNTHNDGYQVVYTGQGKLIEVIVCNSAASTKYLQVFDATSLPTNGTVPTVATLAIAATSTATLELSHVGGLVVQNGIVVAESSTALTLTSSGTDLLVTTFYAVLVQL